MIFSSGHAEFQVAYRIYDRLAFAHDFRTIATYFSWTGFNFELFWNTYLLLRHTRMKGVKGSRLVFLSEHLQTTQL
jgi:hypothetical protein